MIHSGPRVKPGYFDLIDFGNDLHLFSFITFFLPYKEIIKEHERPLDTCYYIDIDVIISGEFLTGIIINGQSFTLSYLINPLGTGILR